MSRLIKAEPIGSRLRLVTGKEEYQPPSLRLYEYSILSEKRKGVNYEHGLTGRPAFR